MARSESQKRADKVYESKFFRLQVKIPFKEKERIDNYVKETGESVSAFVRRAIDETINNSK